MENRNKTIKKYAQLFLPYHNEIFADEMAKVVQVECK